MHKTISRLRRMNKIFVPLVGVFKRNVQSTSEAGGRGIKQGWDELYAVTVLMD